MRPTSVWPHGGCVSVVMDPVEPEAAEHTSSRTGITVDNTGALFEGDRPGTTALHPGQSIPGSAHARHDALEKGHSRGAGGPQRAR